MRDVIREPFEQVRGTVSAWRKQESLEITLLFMYNYADATILGLLRIRQG
ncbi:hypothetical protein [Listeria costaricensis]|nr:hypothetical protein [Listeria costaricensis]